MTRFNPNALALWAVAFIVGYLTAGVKLGMACLAAALFVSVTEYASILVMALVVTTVCVIGKVWF